MDYFSNQRRCNNNRRPGYPSCDCDTGCGAPPQAIMPSTPRPPVQQPARPMPCSTPTKPNCGCASNIAPMIQPDCGCGSNVAPMVKPGCGCGSNVAPMTKPGCGCGSNVAPMPKPSCGCGSNVASMTKPGCGCQMNRPNPACTNQAVANDMCGYPVGMCYVPWQRWPDCPYEFCRAFQTGTIFPDLDKPFVMGRCAR